MFLFFVIQVWSSLAAARETQEDDNAVLTFGSLQKFRQTNSNPWGKTWGYPWDQED